MRPVKMEEPGTCRISQLLQGIMPQAGEGGRESSLEGMKRTARTPRNHSSRHGEPEFQGWVSACHQQISRDESTLEVVEVVGISRAKHLAQANAFAQNERKDERTANKCDATSWCIYALRCLCQQAQSCRMV